MKENFLAKDRFLHLIYDGEKYIEIDRNGRTYNDFHMQNCRKPEVQFLNLVKEYNRVIGQGDNPHPELKISITGEVFDAQKGYTSEIKYKIIEKPEELEQVKKEFEDNIVEMFASYIFIKHEGKEICAKKLHPDIEIEVNEFKEKLAYALSRETIFGKDIGDISKKYIDNSKNYDPEIIYRTVESILTIPIPIELGYLEMINQINDNYFKDYKMNNKLNDNTEPNTNENTEEDQNILDKLSRDQRNSIRNILYESPIYLYNFLAFIDVLRRKNILEGTSFFHFLNIFFL
ncbi:hypothetical protein PIROE2DRAFT_15740 [Piromyces sp. E2]|nr:hypothetical protein PIROE2DRAFT_15740 [Piromyces sp. E2]|eukprot:OUM58888.1 hypothetical protein PIROE2DRAFT_15740 [Piromyces sp. E2]